MLNMARRLKRIRRVAPDVAARRDQIIGLRLRDGDRRRLVEMARLAEVGVSTYARLIIEQYIETHAPARKKS
jgi:hypothetical protein